MQVFSSVVTVPGPIPVNPVSRITTNLAIVELMCSCLNKKSVKFHHCFTLSVTFPVAVYWPWLDLILKLPFSPSTIALSRPYGSCLKWTVPSSSTATVQYKRSTGMGSGRKIFAVCFEFIISVILAAFHSFGLFSSNSANSKGFSTRMHPELNIRSDRANSDLLGVSWR